MDKAKDIDELVKKIADLVGMGERVSYNLETLEYGHLMQMQLDEYSEYIEMEELPEDIEEELHDWEIDCVKYLRWALDLPDRIDPPRNREVFEWMADFAEAHDVGGRFIREVELALCSRHPFGEFKDVMYDYGLIDAWYKYQAECHLDYVRRELELDEEDESFEDDELDG